MSENSNKNNLQNRLDSMFSDLGEPNEVPGLSIFNQMNGWTWEITARGLFIESSPEVAYLLGIPRAQLLDQPISQISDFDVSDPNLPRTMKDTIHPTQVTITFLHQDGTAFRTSCYILPQFDEKSAFTGWRGVTLEENLNTSLILEEDLGIDEEDLPLPLKDLISSAEPPVPTPKEVSQEVLEVEETQAPPVQENTAGQNGESPVARVPQSNIDPAILAFLHEIDDDPNREWQTDEIQLVKQVHNQLDLALENATLFQQTQQALAETDEQARRLRLLNDLSERLGQVTNLLETYQQTVSTVIKVFNANQANIAIWTESRDELEVCATAGEDNRINIGQLFSPEEQIFHTPIKRSSVFVDNEFSHPLYPETGSVIIGPIFASGVIQGIILIGHKLPHRFGDQDKNFLTQIISILSAVLENRSLFDAIEKALATTEEQARRLGELNQLSEMLGQATSYNQVMELVLNRIDRIIPCMVSQAILYNQSEDTYTTYQIENGSLVEAGRINNPEGSFLGMVIESNRATTISNLDEVDLRDLDLMRALHNIQSVIGAPLGAGEVVLGSIMVANHKDFTYTSQDETLMMSIASILASTLDNRQLFQQIQRRSVQLETSAEVSRIASTILDPDELLPEVVELIKTGFNLYYAGIFLIDHTGERTGEPGRWAVLRAGSGEPGQQMLAAGHKLQVGGSSMIGSAIAESQAQISHDVGAAAHFFRNPYLPDTRSEMALPLVSRGQVLGALTIQSQWEAAFSQEDVTSLQTMADQLSNAIENARLFEQAEIRAEELTVLNEMARAYTQTLDIDRLVESSLEYTGRLMNADNYYLALFNPETNMIDFRIFVEEGQRIPPPEPKIYLGEGLTDWIITNRQPVLMQSNVEEEMRSMGIEVRGRSAESWLGVPLLIGNNVLGVIAVQSYTPGIHYHQRELDLLSAIASQTAVAIDNGLRFFQTQARAQYEQILREITTRVHTSTNAESILKTAVQEVGTALGRQAYIELSLDEDAPKSTLPAQGQDNHHVETAQQPPADDQTNER